MVQYVCVLRMYAYKSSSSLIFFFRFMELCHELFCNNYRNLITFSLCPTLIVSSCWPRSGMRVSQDGGRGMAWPSSCCAWGWSWLYLSWLCTTLFFLVVRLDSSYVVPSWNFSTTVLRLACSWSSWFCALPISVIPMTEETFGDLHHRNWSGWFFYGLQVIHGMATMLTS